MTYIIYKDGAAVNRIVAEEEFCRRHYSAGGYSYAPDQAPDPAEGELRAAKLQEAGAACSAAIYAGVEVGEARYSLTEHDQTEIMAQLATVKEGAAAVPYHADGELCRMYPAAEFAALAQAATAHVFYHRTYCNHLNAWIRRAGLEELPSISYGADLPEDLAERMMGILAEAAAEQTITSGGEGDV